MMSLVGRTAATQGRRYVRQLGVSNALLRSHIGGGRTQPARTASTTSSLTTHFHLNRVQLPALTQEFRSFSVSSSEEPPDPAFLLEPPVTLEMTIQRLDKRFGHPGISTTTLDEWMTKTKDAKTGLVLLDVREMEEFNVSHLEGARRASPDQDDLDSIYDYVNKLHEDCPEVNIACYCSVGYRASMYAEALERYIKGKTGSSLSKSAKVYNVVGGLFKWSNEHRAMMVDSHGNMTSKAHPFNDAFGVMLDRDLWQTTVN